MESSKKKKIKEIVINAIIAIISLLTGISL